MSERPRRSRGAAARVMGQGGPAPLVIGVLALTIGAQITVPMEPVPMTLQTLALLIVAGLLGPARGAAAGAAYLLLGLAGVPVFADWGALPAAEALESKTVGYLVGFVPAAALAGRARGNPLGIGLVFLAAHAVILVLGFGWLATKIGAGPALEHGLEPFLLGAAAKSVCAAAVVVRLRGGAVMS